MALGKGHIQAPNGINPLKENSSRKNLVMNAGRSTGTFEFPSRDGKV